MAQGPIKPCPGVPEVALGLYPAPGVLGPSVRPLPTPRTGGRVGRERESSTVDLQMRRKEDCVGLTPHSGLESRVRSYSGVGSYPGSLGRWVGRT